MYQHRAGVLCYSLMPATSDLLNRLSTRLNANSIKLKAFPLVTTDISNLKIYFSYRPTIFSGRYLTFKGFVPENQLLAIQSSTIYQLMKESDIIILLGIQSIPALLSVLIARIAGKPVLTINQTMPPELEAKRLCLIRWIKKIILHMSQLHIVQTESSKKTLQKIYKIPHDRLVYAPFDGGGKLFNELIKELPPIDINSIRKQYRIPKDAIVFIFVGTLIYLKGVDVLIDAIAKLCLSIDNVYLLVVGPDGRNNGQLAILKSRVRVLNLSDRVIFAGQKDAKELIALYSASNVFVLPTRKDVWPKVLVEAALIGLPLITTSVSSAAYTLVKNGINGFIVPQNNVQELTNAMLKSINSKTRKDMGLHSRKIVSEFIQPEFEADRIVDGILRSLKFRD